jgi:serine/threonine-protein kinase
LAQLTKEGVEKALDLFHQVIKKDPTYALAYAGISDCHARNTWYYYRPPKEELPKALAFAEKALALDPQLSEAHVSLGYTKMLYDRKWDKAGAEFQRAIELNPGNALAHNFYSVYYAVLGKFDKSIEEAQKALDLSPADLWMWINLGMRYYYSNQFEMCLKHTQKAIVLDPHSFLGHCYSVFPLIFLGRTEEALQAAHKAAEVLGEYSPHILIALGLAHSSSNNRKEAEKIISELVGLSDKGTIPTFSIAWIYTSLEERGKAYEWMERAVDKNDPLIMWIKSDPMFKRLEGDPRYNEMLKKLGLDR